MRLKTLKINDPINWFRRYEIECRTIEKGFAAHGTADYIIGPLIGEEKTLKVRSYKLNHPYLTPNTGEPIQCPMKSVMKSLFDNSPSSTKRV